MSQIFRHFGSRIETRDARYQDTVAVGRIMAAIQNSVGTLDPDDVTRIESILQRYTGSGAVNKLGATMPSWDSVAAGKASASAARASVEAIQSVNRANRAFWDAHLAEHRV
jgi:hypothetical protein